MKKSFKSKSKAFIVLLIVTVAFAVFTATTVLSAGPDKVAEASTASSISLSQLAGGSWTWDGEDHKTEVTIGQWRGSSFKRYTDNTLGVGYCFDSGSWVSTSTIEYTVPNGQTIESFSLSITTTAAVRIQYSIYKPGNKNYPYGYDYPESGIAAQSGNTYSVTNSVIYHRNTYKGTTLTGGDKITFAIYDSDVIDHSGSTIYTGGKVARDGNIAVTSLSITLNNAAYSVSINAGTGIKEAFLSTSSVATSGSASGTKFDVDSYVYGFVKLNAGYRKPNSANWTLIDGTANQANAIYRVAEQKVGSQTVDFGTVNAEAKTKNLYKMDGSISKGYETLNWSQAKTIPAITKTGYNFINYNTAADGTGTTYGNSSGASLTATQVNAIIDSSISSFYAQWSAKTFDVTFNKEGGTGGDDGVTMTYDQPAPGSIAVPSKPGYTFQGYTATHPTNYTVITVYNSNGEATSSKWQIDSAVSPRATWYGKPYKAYITAGTGVKSVYLSSSYSATPDSSSAKPSGTSFTNGQYLCAYIVLERGYVAPAGWELSGGDYYVGDGVFRKSVLVDIASDEEEYLQYDFGTIDATLGNFAVGISAGTGVSAVNLSAKDDGEDLVSSGSKFVFDSQVYAYATLSVGYNAQDGWTLIDGEAGTAGALYLVDTIEHIDIDSDFGALSATPKQYTVTLDGLDDPITATYDAPLSALEQLPTREGYTFIGYYDQPEGGNQYINEDGTSTGRIWIINEDAPQLYAHWLKSLSYEVNNYNGDYDRNPHTISYAVTEPESGAVILFGTAEDDYVLAENELPTYTDVGVYTIYYQISADVSGVLYKTVKGSATVTITKVDTTALSALIDVVNDYCDAINDDYPTIASTLEGHKQQIINDYITEDNVTEAEVAAAVVELQGYLDKAHADVVDELIDAIGIVDLVKEDEIYSARVAYNNLTDDQKALVVDIEDLVDAEVELVELLIVNIAPFEYTQACKDRIEKAREFYDDLTADQKDEVDNYQDLVNAEKAYDAIAKIKAIGKPVTNDDATREKATTAREAYAGLSDAQKALVTPSFVTDLENAEDVLEFLDALNDIGAPTDTKTFRDKVEAARDLYDALDEADLETLVKPEDLKTLTDDEALVPVMDAIDALGTPANTETFRDAAEDARSDYNALTDDQKDIFPEDVLKILTDDEAVIDVMNEINALGNPANTDVFREAVDAARDNYDALSDDQKALVPADVLKTLEDDEAVVEFMDAVNAIGTPENTDAFREAVEAARENYDALSDDQKALVPEGVLKTLEDDEAVVEFMDAVNAIGTPEDTEAFRDKVEAARDLYDALDEAGIKTLVKPEDLKTLTDDEALVPVMDAIGALGTPENTDDFRDAAEGARSDYNALTDDQKALFPASVLKILTDDEAIIDVMDEINALGDPVNTDAFREAVEGARENYEALSNDQKALVPEGVLKTLEDDEAVVEFMDAVNAIGTPENTDVFRDAVDAARDKYDALSDDQKALVPADVLKTLEDDEAVIEFMDAVNAIGTPEDTEAFRNKVEKARDLYDALDEAGIKTLVKPEDLKTLTDDEALVPVMDAIDALGTPANTETFRDAAEDARSDYNALSPDQKELFPKDVLKTLTDDEAIIDVLNEINAIGEVTYTLECKEKIDAAREGYDALSADQESIFPQVDLQSLIDAEKAYEAMDLINAIGSVEYTAESKAKIDIALGAFEALTPEQKELVLNHTELPAAQVTYDELAANSVKTMIAGIGKVKHPDSKDTIDRARTAYDELTEKQKELVDNYDTLTEAEEIYASYDKKEHVSTVMGWVLFVLVILELLYLALYFILWYPKAGTVAEKLKLGALKPLLGKIVLFGFIDLLLLIGSAASVVIFILALAALAVYATPISIATFVLAFLVMAAYGVLIFFGWKKRGEEGETAGEPKDPDIKETAAPAEEVSEEVLSTVKEDKVTETTAEPVEEEKDEEVIVVTENGATFRIQIVKSFTAKLIQSSDETKRYYRELKNEILSYKGINSRASWNYESFNFGRKQAVKIAVRGKTLCLYFALDMKDLKGSKYRVELCKSAKYAAVPCMYRIRNDRRCEYAKDLIAMVAEKFGLVKGKNPNKEYSFPYEDNAALLAKGLIKEVKSKIAQPVANEHIHLKSVTVSEADAQMTDEVAATFIEDDVDGKAHSGKKGIINIDVLSANFSDGDTVDIEALWEKKLVPASVGRVKLLARGSLDKALNVDLQDYSLQAVKMIVLVGGTVHRAK